MISLRTEMKNLRIILALACSFAAFQHAAAQSKAPGRAPGTVFRDCHECPEMVVVPAGSFTMEPWRTQLVVGWFGPNFQGI
jgi:formylglycine-generating enzyme required for sulfatase activity